MTRTLQRIATVTLLFALGAGTTAWAAQPATQPDCVEINNDFSQLQAAKAKGLYRYSNKAKVAEFDYQALPPFSDYLAYSRQLIEQKNPQAARPCPLSTPVTQLLHKEQAQLQVSDLVAPFELRQPDQKKAILLIHGLTDSPFLFHDLAGFFYQQGFTVRTLLLPGHGTAPSDLLDVSERQWRQAARYAIERTSQDFEQVYLGGFSTGGALMLDYLLQQPSVSPKIAGLLLWSPASKAKDSLAFLAGVVDWIPLLDWVNTGADTDFAKYESFPFNAGAQVYNLMQRLPTAQKAPANKKVPDIPLLVLASAADTTIDTAATVALTNFWHQAPGRQTQAKDLLVYYGDLQQATPAPAATLAVTVPHCEPAGLCARVHDMAHTALTNSPDNPHYGAAGHYRNCNHYSNDRDYQQCKTATSLSVGETTEHNLRQYRPLQRLTYNPYYPQMLDSIRQFIR